MKSILLHFVFLLTFDPTQVVDQYQQNCGCPADLMVMVNQMADSLSGWDVLLLENGISFVSKETGEFRSQVSLSAHPLPDTAGSMQYPVRVFAVLLPRISDRKFQRILRSNSKVELSIRKNPGLPPKTYLLDVKSQALQDRIRQRYRLLPTHRFDECSDLLVFVDRPSFFLMLHSQNPLYPELRRILEFFDRRYLRFPWSDIETYLGFLKDDLIGER